MPANLRRACACSAFVTIKFSIAVMAIALVWLLPSAQAATRTVYVGTPNPCTAAFADSFFDAASCNSTTTITLGDTVQWLQLNVSLGDEHTSTSGLSTQGCNGSGLWNLPAQTTCPVPLKMVNNNTSYTHTFNAAGSYAYYCIPHGSGMIGTVIVNKGTASVVLSSLPSSTTYGQPITFTATVTSGIVAPTGSVNFIDSNFGTILATAPISTGTATVTLATVPVGSYNVFASYSGDGNFVASNSAGVQPLTVNPATTSIVMNSVSGTSLAGQSVSFTATVSNLDSALTPSGNVTFTDNGPVVATIPPDVNGMAVWTTNTLPGGINSITASFHDPSNPPTGNFSDSGPTAAITQTVQDYVIDIPNPALTATLGQTVNYNGTLKALGGFNTAVTLSCGAGAPGTCTPPSPVTPTVAGAAFSVAAKSTVSGTFNFNIVGTGSLTRQQPVSLVVSDFVLGNLTNAPALAYQGNPSSPVSFTVTSEDFTGAVNLTCTGAGGGALPPGVTCNNFNFSQNPVSLGINSSATVTLTIDTTTSTPTGPIAIEIHGAPTPGATNHTLALTLNVSAGSGSFDLSVFPFKHINTPDPVMVGGTLEFDATVNVCPTSTCSGTAATTLVVDFDSPVKVISTSFQSNACSVTGSVVTCAGPLASGSSAMATIKVVPLAPFQRSLTATAHVSSTSADPTPGNNVRTDTALIRVRPLARKSLVPKQP